MILLLVLILNMCSALKIDSIGALGLFQNCAGNGILGVTRLFHTVIVRRRNNFSQLISLLNHKRFPFDHVYAFGCETHVTKQRIKELVRVTARYDNSEADRTMLLPVNCFKSGDIETGSFKPGHFFSKFPSDTSPIPLMKSKVFLWHLDEARREVGLIQNCNWLFQVGVPRILQLEPPRVAFGARPAWSSIHHSCYIADTTTISSERKFTGLIDNLVREYPLLALDLKRDDISELARWCLHLSLIMINLQSCYTFILPLIN